MNLKELILKGEYINEIQKNVDKYGKDYLVLKLDGNKTVFCFANKVSKDRWDSLMTGKIYDLNVVEDNNGFWSLVDFSFPSRRNK